MGNHDLKDSSILSDVYKAMTMKCYFWNNRATTGTINIVFKGFASFLAKKKSKDKPAALCLRDNNDGFHFGAIVEFLKAEESGGDEGSWSLSYTFDENDIDPNTMDIYNIPESQEAKDVIEKVAFKTEGIFFSYTNKTDNDEDNSKEKTATPEELMCIIFDCIRSYMKANVTIDPVLNITGIAKLTAVADANTNSVIIGIEPDAELRQIIKDDKVIDK